MGEREGVRLSSHWPGFREGPGGVLRSNKVQAGTLGEHHLELMLTGGIRSGQFVARKTKTALEGGLGVILCVGETLEVCMLAAEEQGDLILKNALSNARATRPLTWSLDS